MELKIVLDPARDSYEPGDEVGGAVVIAAPRAGAVRLTLAHAFQVRSPQTPDEDLPDLEPDEEDEERPGQKLLELFSGEVAAESERRFPFSVRAPAGPFSHAGRVVALEWALEAKAEGAWEATARRVYRLVPGRAAAPARPSSWDEDDKTVTPNAAPGPKLPALVVAAAAACWAGTEALSGTHFARTHESLAGALFAVLFFLGILSTALAIALSYWFVSTAWSSWRSRSALGPCRVRFSAREVRRGQTLSCEATVEPPRPYGQVTMIAALKGEESFDPGRKRSLVQALIRRDALTADCASPQPGLPLTRRFEWRVPEDAALSFDEGQGAVDWSVELLVKADGKVRVDDSWLVDVLP